MSNSQEILARQAELERQLAEVRKEATEALRAERSDVIGKIKAMMASHGITVADLSTKPGRPPKERSGEQAPTRKVAAKYHDTATGDSWSGRGLKPKWLSAALESGRKIEEFLI